MTIKVIGTTGELGRLMAATDSEKPKQADRQALSAYLDEHGTTELARIGDLSDQAQNAIIGASFAHNHGFARAVVAKLGELERELGYGSASPLEQMLIKHIIVCWLRLYDCEFRYEMMRKDKPTIAQAEHWEKRLSAAQRRYLRAIEALARVRRLLYRPDPPNVAFNLLLKQQVGGK